jgi:polygalacturonase
MSMPRLLALPLAFLAFASALWAAPTPTVFNVLDYGAVPDGKTKNTAAIAKAIAACAKAGGGTVFFPAGRYLTGSIMPESNQTLHFDAGSELLYSGDAADSPIVKSRWESTNVYTHASLIYADGKENIAITGRGKINGQGWNWWWRSNSRGRKAPAGIDAVANQAAWRAVYKRIEAGEKLTAADFTQAAEFLRPSLIGIYNCRNVLIDGVTLYKSPMWMLHPAYTDDIVIHGVRFVSSDPEGSATEEGEGPNGDGIDVDSCRNVRISDCFFSTSDDCIVIKSGRDNDGIATARPTEYVTITNCVMYKGHGAVVIGSETSGNIRDITASNIVSKGTDTGIRIKSQRGRGGLMENFRFDNWVIEDAQKIALEITTRYGRTEEAPFSKTTPVFRNFAYSNITIVNAKKVATVEGLPEKAIEGLRFTDITATGNAGFIADHAVDVELHNFRLTAATGSAFSFDTSSGIVFNDVSPRTAAATTPAIAILNSSDLVVRNSRAATATGAFLSLSGAKTSGVVLAANDLSRAQTDVVLGDGVTAAAVTKK